MFLLQGHGVLLDDADVGVLGEGHLPLVGGGGQLVGVLVNVHLGIFSVHGLGG